MVSYICRNGEGVQEYHATRYNLIAGRKLQGHPTINGHRRKEDVGGVVLTDRFGHKTSAGGGPWQDIKVGGKTEECASTHTSCMEGIPKLAMAEHKIRDCNACHTWEGNRGDTMQAQV
jgi:hypothetical protein